MTDTPAPSCAALAAQLIVEGCLPIIQGKVQGRAPVDGVPVADQQREKLGLTEPSMTLFYPAGESGVFFDGAGNRFTIWFNGEDCEEATDALHNALNRAFASTRQMDEVPHPREPRMKARVYNVDLGEGLQATIHTSFGQAGPSTPQFMAEVRAFRRQN